MSAHEEDGWTIICVCCGVPWHAHTEEQADDCAEAHLLDAVSDDTPWRDAVLDARTVAFLPPDPDQDPRQALAELIEWHVQTALDPLVSAQARALMSGPIGAREARVLIRETVERACRALCKGCRLGIPVEADPQGKLWHGWDTHRQYGQSTCLDADCVPIRREFEEVLRG